MEENISIFSKEQSMSVYGLVYGLVCVDWCMWTGVWTVVYVDWCMDWHMWTGIWTGVCGLNSDASGWELRWVLVNRATDLWV